jgi:type I restriction enzyme, S subunit
MLESLGNGATFKEVSKAVMSRVEMPLPPLPEQRRIAEVLDRAETLRAQRRQALAQFDALAESIFESLFGNSRGSVKTIGELLSLGALLVHKDGNHGSLYPRADDFVQIGIPFISARAIRDDGRIDDRLIEHLHPDKAAKLRLGWIIEGDVLLSHNASVGKVAYYDGRFESALIGTSLTAFRPNPQVLTSAYLTAALRSSKFQRSLEKNMGQTTRNQVPITAQRDLQLSLPPLEVQREFASQMEAIERAKALQHASLASLDALFASLQHRAFRGEL